MTTATVCYWKQLWRWTTSNSLSSEELTAVLDKKEIIDALREGLASYKPGKKEGYAQLQAKHTDQTALLNVVHTLQNYMDVDCFQIWEIVKHYLCDISYGTTANALKNVAFVDTRPTFLLPNIWNFYYVERLFLLKLLQYILQHKDDKSHKYQPQFSKIMNDIGLDKLRESLISQFEKVLYTAPPPRRIHNEFSSDTIRMEWAEFKLREQVAILQNILLLADEKPFLDGDFVKLFLLYKKHNFGKNLGYNELLEQEHKELCTRLMYLETCIFMVLVAKVDKSEQKLSSWIDKTKDVVESELTQLQLSPEHSPMLMSWMLLLLQLGQKFFRMSEFKELGYPAVLAYSSHFSTDSREIFLAIRPQGHFYKSDCESTGISQEETAVEKKAERNSTSKEHAKLFESQYHHFGATAIKMRLFEFLHTMLSSPVFSDESPCALIAKRHTFRFLNDLCDRFDGDGTISNQPGVMPLCSLLLETEETANEFWNLMQKEEDNGVVSLWNTALEYFPYNFSALSVLAAGLAKAGINSVRNLIAELKSLPVYTEIYNPNTVPIMALNSEEAVIARDHYPLGGPSYHVEAGSKATIMERKEGMMIHYRTPYSYWTVLSKVIEQALDRKGHHQHDVVMTLQRVYEGTMVLKNALKALVNQKEIPKALVEPSEGVFDVLVRFMKAETPPLPLLVECLEMCTALIPMFPKEIHMRLINTGLLPRIMNRQLSPAQYAAGEALDSAAVGAYLVTLEQPSGTYSFLRAYIEMLCTFHEICGDDERISLEIILPGLVLTLREVFPSVSAWRYHSARERRALLHLCSKFLNLLLQQTRGGVLKDTCVFSLLYTENALELLKIVSIGNNQLERAMYGETNWTSGECTQHVTTIQRCVAIVMFALRLKSTVTGASDVTPLEHLVFAQNAHKGALRVVPKVASYINHAFNKHLPVLCFRLLKKFADGFQMSLFASLDMTAYQVRVMFLDRLSDKYETTELKIAILEFVATCIGNQPGLTEAFFNISHEKVKEEDKEKAEKSVQEKKDDDGFEGVLSYMADYLGTVKADPKLLDSPLLSCIMGLFHALWKNNMQVLVKKLRENPKFWEHMTSPLFSEIQPGLNTYAQIFNVLGIELFVSREKLEPGFKDMLEKFFDTNKNHLDTWIDYIFSFKCRCDGEEMVDKVPVWLGLLTSWKDFTTIFCKCLPISLNIAHKAKMVAPCMTALLDELDELNDGRLVVMLAELYVIMLANWKDDCFENRKASAKQIDHLLTNTTVVYESLHPRAVRAILSIGTVAISTLDYEIKANSAIAQSIIRSVTNINSLELEKLFDGINQVPAPKPEQNSSEEIPPVVLSLAMLEQCLELYDNMFVGLPQWFQSTRFINKLLCCLHNCLHDRRQYHTSLAALRCLTACARGPFADELLMSDVDQFLWMKLLPPKFEQNGDGTAWKPEEWWRVYGYSLDFISMMVMKHGQFFAGDAITFVGVHLEHLVEAVLLPRQLTSLDALNLCASTLNLVVQLVKYESRWRIENINSLMGIMRSISACLYQCVTLILRSRRSSDPALPPLDENQQSPTILHRILEILHMATLCLHSFSPALLPLLADPALDVERWQPLVELHFGAPKISYEPFPQLTFGTLLAAICMLTRSLNHAYHSEESCGARSPRGRRRLCSCGSPGEPRRANRSESLTSISSQASAGPLLNDRLVAGALEATTTLAASQALLVVRDPNVPSRHKQHVRRELASELALFHDFVRKRILCGAHSRSHLARNQLGAWPLPSNEEELKRIQEARGERNPTMEKDDTSLPPPPPPKRSANDSMREYILRKHYLHKCAQTPTKEPSPVSHSTPAPDKKKEASRSSKRVSWAETTSASDESLDSSLEAIEPVYSNLTDVQINNDEDYFHFMSVVFLYICQNEL